MFSYSPPDHTLHFSWYTTPWDMPPLQSYWMWHHLCQLCVGAKLEGGGSIWASLVNAVDVAKFNTLSIKWTIIELCRSARKERVVNIKNQNTNKNCHQKAPTQEIHKFLEEIDLWKWSSCMQQMFSTISTWVQ